MEKLFELTFQDQTLNPQVGTFTDVPQTTGTFTLEDGEYYLTNGDTKGFYAYGPVAMQSGLVDDGKVIIEFDLKVVTASVNTHAIIGTYAGVDGNGVPTGAKITLQYNAGDIELVLGSGTTETLIAAADVAVGQWYHFRIDCYLAAPLASTYQVKIDGVSITTVTGAVADYALGIISVLGTDLYACDECGIKNITLVTETNMYVGRTALDQALQDVKGYVDSHYVNVSSNQTIGGQKTFTVSPRVTKTSPDIALNISDCDVTELPTEAKSATLYFRDKNNKNLSYIVSQQRTDGKKRMCLRTHRTDNINNYYSVNLDSDGDFYPEQNNKINLGTPALQWNNAYIKSLTINGVACGDILTHNASEFVPRSGGAVISGNSLGRISSTSYLHLYGGTGWGEGAVVALNAKGFASGYAGAVSIAVNDGSQSRGMDIRPDGTWTWDGTACQIISDQRLKQQIAEIDDKLLDAWEDVNLVQFKYNDAVDQKKDKARLHTGYVVQQIDSACKSHDVDISQYGLYCHEEYHEETEEVEVEQADGTKVKERKVIREASEHYSLRYTEVYAVECMYLRRCIKQLTARIEQLEKGKEQEAGK